MFMTFFVLVVQNDFFRVLPRCFTLLPKYFFEGIDLLHEVSLYCRTLPASIAFQTFLIHETFF